MMFMDRCIIYNSYRNSQQDATVFQNFLLFHVYIKLNMFRATHRPSSGAQNCTSSLWFCISERSLNAEVAGRCQRPATSASNNLYLCSLEIFKTFGVLKAAKSQLMIRNWSTKELHILRALKFTIKSYVTFIAHYTHVRHK
jgi:hypothetical protein